MIIPMYRVLYTVLWEIWDYASCTQEHFILYHNALRACTVGVVNVRRIYKAFTGSTG